MEKTDKKIEQEMASYKGETPPPGKTVTRETAIQVTVTLEALLIMFESWMEPGYVKEKMKLIKIAISELYPSVDYEQSFEDFRKTLDVSIPKDPEDFNLVSYGNDMIPANGRYDMIGTKEINDYIPQ